MDKARAAIGRPDITWHGIRHRAGTELGRGSASDKLVGKALGHSPNSTATRRYRHAMNDEVQSALDSMPDIGLPMMIEEMSDQPHASIARKDDALYNEELEKLTKSRVQMVGAA